MSTTEKESSLDPDEPHTPLWFTFLGIGLFMVGGIFLLATGDDEEATAAETAAAEDAPEPEEEPAAEKPTGAAPTPDPHAGHNH